MAQSSIKESTESKESNPAPVGASLQTFKTGLKRTALPPAIVGNISDEEDWLDPSSHPIDWYTEYLERVIAGSESGYDKQEQELIGVIWKNFKCGIPCPFQICKEDKLYLEN